MENMRKYREIPRKIKVHSWENPRTKWIEMGESSLLCWVGHLYSRTAHPSMERPCRAGADGCPDGNRWKRCRMGVEKKISVGLHIGNCELGISYHDGRVNFLKETNRDLRGYW